MQLEAFILRKLTQNRKTKIACPHLEVGAKYQVHMDIKMETTDTGDSEGGREGGGEEWKNSLLGTMFII